MQMGTTRILLPLSASLSPSFCRQSLSSVQTLSYTTMYLSLPLSFSIPIPVCSARWLSVWQFAAAAFASATAAAVSCLRIECIAFNIYSLLFPFSATFFFSLSLLCTFFFPSAQEKNAQNTEQKTPPSGGRGKLKM